MPALEFELHAKQWECWEYLTDDITTFIGYWWAAWWWKSFLWCAWVLAMCIAYPWSRWFIARNELKRLKQSTLMTLLADVHPINNITPDVHFIYKQQDWEIVYYNWSKIYLLDASWMPSDPMYQRFWSLEFCGWYVDEMAELKHLAVQILISRCRYRLDDFWLIPKVFWWFNPDKWRVYSEFYKPYKEWTLPKDKAFIPALATDNPSISQHYLKQLEKLPEMQKQRLLFGNFDYDDTPWRLYDYDDILDMRTNSITNWEKYIICDPARLWEDEAVIMVFDWWEEKETVVYEKCTLDVIENKIKQLQQKYWVNMKNVLVDADWIGAWIVDNLKCVPFHNWSSPLQTKEEKHLWLKPNFENLKTQCAFRLQDFIRSIRINSQEIKEKLSQELDIITERDMDKDGKRKIIKKEEIKEKIWRSPNYFDVLMMRCYYELENIPDYVWMAKRWMWW